MGLLDDMKKRMASAVGLDNDEARNNMDQLKSNVAEIGRQLKESGKVVASQAYSSAKQIRSGEQGSSSEEVEPNNAIVVDMEKQKGILEHSENPVTSSDEKVRAAQGDRDNGPLTRSSGVSSMASQIAGRFKALPKPIVGIVLAFLILLVLIIFSFVGSCSGHSEPDEPTVSLNVPMQTIALELECERNLIFSTYNVDVYVDDQKLGTLEHGGYGRYTADLPQGTHTLLLTKEGDKDVNGQMNFEVEESGETFGYVAQCKSDRIEIEQLSETDANERYAEELQQIANQPGEKASAVIQQLESKDYKTAGYSLVCLEAENALQDFNAEDYSVESGEVDSSDKKITLRLKYAKVIQPSFEKELAIRVATVAMTNCWATDVFDDAGAYDVGKFHSFADLSGYYMFIEGEGEWTGVDEATWHVEGMKLKASEGLCLVLKADISFNGSDYIVSSVEVTYGNSFEDIESGDEWSTGRETYEPSASLPFLTVSPGLIEEGRDEGVEAAKAEEKTAEESAAAAAAAEETEYENWVGSHFSLWDGKCDKLVDLVKDRLNDESSFKHIQTSYVPLRDQETLDNMNSLIIQAGGSGAAMNDVVVVMEFSAKNGFNATIKSQAVGVIRYPSGDVELVGIA